MAPRRMWQSYGQMILRLAPDVYDISWKFDHAINRTVVTNRRLTTLRGALKFADKWKVVMPRSDQ